MYVRLAFAISVNVKADILIIDEALAVGDTAFSFKCLHRMEELLSNNTTILLVSHDIQLVKQLCQRIVYLNNGQMVYTGDCETGSELYLMDIRTDQQKAEQSWSIQVKPSLNDLNGFSFGNQLGNIIHISMGSGECEKQHFQSGEKVWLKVVAKIDPSVRKARLAMVIRDEKGYNLLDKQINAICFKVLTDKKGYNLFGYDSEVLGKKSLHPDAEGRVDGMFLFTCRLQPGNYSVTMRLEDFQTESLNILLDKQINAICFKVLTDKKQFYGVVNLDGCFGEVDVSKPNIAVPEETN
jgi:lipopolysaccharide transport system ATP-binding protein